MSLMNAENILSGKLNEFIRKYYKNKIIRGSLISLGLLLSLYLIGILLEYFSYFPSLTRIFIVCFFVGASLGNITFFVVVPLLSYLRIGKTLTHEQAAAIIGEHFSEIGDKLLNTLQLIEQKNSSPESIGLLVASIEQRIKALRPIPFSGVINLRKNLKFLKYALPPLLILLFLLIIAPSIISDPTRRLIHYSEKFSPPALFRIIILNKELKVMQQEDFNLKVELRGNEIPDEVSVKTGNSTFPMKRDGKSGFSFLFRALQANTFFTLIADDKESEQYEISIYPKPIIMNFEARLEYPQYTGKQSETLDNIGDFIIPEGSLITWTVTTRNVTMVKFRFPAAEIRLEKKNKDMFICKKRFDESVKYSILQENEFSKNSDSLSYLITAIKDAFPEITLVEAPDTAFTGKLFLQGTIRDDYGFTKLSFTLSVKGQTDSLQKLVRTELITLDKNKSSQPYFYSVDFSSIAMNPGDKYSYYFEVWDNDGIHGPKSSRTFPLTFEIPTLDKIAEQNDKNSEDIQKNLNKSLQETRDVSKTLDEMTRRMIEQNDVSWKEKKKLEDVIRANEKIQKQVEEYKERNEQNIKNEEQYLKTSERILSKQKQLNELANQLLTDEMKKTVEEMKSLLNQMDKNKLNELLPKIKQMNEELEKELDRNLQLFKQFEFERKLEKSTAELKNLANEQSKLAEKTDGQKKLNEQLAMEQQQIQKKYDSIEKSLKELQKQSQQLESSPDLKSTESDRNSIEKQLDKNNELVKTGKMKDASKNQKKTSQEMKELAEKLESMQQESEEEAQEEDAAALKLLVQNLNKLSFQQEDIIYRTISINRNDPKFLKLIEDQKQIKDKFKTIEDTLNKIARREVMMKSIIMKEVTAVNENLTFSEKTLADRVIPTATGRQQFSMTRMNNLAILLDEALRQMNMDMDNAKMSNGQKAFKKPGKAGGKKSMNSMRQMQQEMSKSLEKMKKELSNSKGGTKTSREKEEGTNREIAKIAAAQEAIRQALQEYENALKEQGEKDNGNINAMIEEMEKNEKDILNRMINQETINRQQAIVSRMLESEKAEQRREKDEKRESTEAKKQLFSNPAANFEYKKRNTGGVGIINFVSAPVNYYYRTKASEYFLKISK